ncbi:CDP-glycerol glycerophosphotransferase family protein [Microbacterium sp. NPDC076911]|uniref:CDP-glycerol glycerophosphotransferase family protein n=1 Tax=Microbacterium sp. NPDC076911 TaxID=3154958 RepID=UPI003436CF01
MASFSFGAGNARKLLTIPLYAVGRVATALIPRSRDEWVFGCGVGIADGALEVWDVAAADHQKAVWLVGSDAHAADARARGIPAVTKHSAKGFWRTARARVVVVTHGFGDVNRYGVSGAFVVQLWHGIPLKRIGIDSAETTRLPSTVSKLPGAALAGVLISFMYRRATARIDLIPAASHLVRGRLESAFSLRDSAVPVTGEPRVDVLSRGTRAQRRKRAIDQIESVVGAVDGASLVLYAPTWRDGAVDPALPSSDDWQRIDTVLKQRDAILLVRSHPLGAGDYAPGFSTGRVRSLGADSVVDVTPLLPGLDALITDYSSLAYDASLVPMPTLFFAPDLEEYEDRRGFYGRYRDVAGDNWATTWTAVIAQLDLLLSDAGEHDRRLELAQRLSDRVHLYDDGRNTDRVYRAILAAARLAPSTKDESPKGSR